MVIATKCPQEWKGHEMHLGKKALAIIVFCHPKFSINNKQTYKKEIFKSQWIILRLINVKEENKQRMEAETKRPLSLPC